jgi:ABC-type transporter Mla MlaB component
MFWLDAKQYGWLHVVAIIGELDLESLASLGRRLESLITSGPSMVVIDLSRLESAPTDLFSLLFLERCRVLGRHGELVVAGAQGGTLMAAYAAYVNGNIPFFPNVASALGSLVQPDVLTQPAAQ